MFIANACLLIWLKWISGYQKLPITRLCTGMLFENFTPHDWFVFIQRDSKYFIQY